MGDSTGSFGSVEPTYGSAGGLLGSVGSSLPGRPSSAKISRESLGRDESASVENIPNAPGNGNPDFFSCEVTSPVRIAPAEVPKTPIFFGLYVFRSSL